MLRGAPEQNPEEWLDNTSDRRLVRAHMPPLNIDGVSIHGSRSR